MSTHPSERRRAFLLSDEDRTTLQSALTSLDAARIEAWETGDLDHGELLADRKKIEAARKALRL